MSVYILKTLLLELLLLGVCYLGDHVLYSWHGVVVAIGDSLTHGLVGGVSWCIVNDVKPTRQSLAECVLCMFLAMVIDVDHFIAARSFSLQAATSLPHRPAFHATTIIIFIDIILLVISIVTKTKAIQLLAMIVTVAWFSHHVRDGTRRGLWLYPLGEMPPLPHLMYLGIEMCFPLLMRVVYNTWKRDSSRTVDGAVGEIV